MANTVLMLLWKEATLVTPVALLDTLMDPPVPEVSKLAKAFGSICLLNVRSFHYLESRLIIVAQVQSVIGTLPDAQTATCRMQ